LKTVTFLLTTVDKEHLPSQQKQKSLRRTHQVVTDKARRKIPPPFKSRVAPGNYFSAEK